MVTAIARWPQPNRLLLSIDDEPRRIDWDTVPPDFQMYVRKDTVILQRNVLSGGDAFASLPTGPQPSLRQHVEYAKLYVCLIARLDAYGAEAWIIWIGDTMHDDYSVGWHQHWISGL